MKRKLVLYIAASLDGFIAGPDDSLDFLSSVQTEGEDYGYHAFIAQVDTVILGRRTYDKVLTLVPEFPHSDKETYVITRHEKPAEGNVNFYSGSLTDLVNRLKSKEGGTIFCDGGAQLVNELLRENLIDEIILSVIPVLLGSGIRLFDSTRAEQPLKLASSESFGSGLVQLHYVLEK